MITWGHVRFHMKSGEVIEIRAKGIKANWSGDTLNSYSIKHMIGVREEFIFLPVAEIAAISYRQNLLMTALRVITLPIQAGITRLRSSVD